MVPSINVMAKIISLFSLFFVAGIFLFAPHPAHAVNVCPPGQFDPLCTISVSDNSSLIRNAINIMLVVAVIASIIFLILGGIRWIMSGGDKAKVDAARGTITAAIIGLIISFLAFFIIGLVQYFFGVKN